VAGIFAARVDQPNEERAGEGSQKKQDSAAKHNRAEPSSSPFKRFLWENSLSIVVLALFLGTWAGQIATGLVSYNNEQRDHGEETVGLMEYLTTGHFIEVTAENWESEFLQMGMFVLLTVFLRQKGSAESKKPYGDEDVDEDPRDHADEPDAPGPVKKGGLALKLYSNSLCLAFLALFLVSFFLHAAGGAKDYSEEQREHGKAPVTTVQYLGTSRFWFESLQNWQSEFLSIAAMVILSIHLRQYGSPESKPVAHGHWKTGSE
jgi:hypothetical protein